MGLKENIKKKRMEYSMTLEELANKVGVSRQTIQRYESGTISNVPSDKIELMAKALHTTPACLMGWEQEDPMENYDYFSQNRNLNEVYNILEENNLKNLSDIVKICRNLLPENEQKVVKYIKAIYDAQEAENELQNDITTSKQSDTELPIMPIEGFRLGQELQKKMHSKDIKRKRN